MEPNVKIPNNAEIDKALKDFEMQSGTAGTGQAQPTGQVLVNPNSDLPKMVQLVIKYSGGAIKDQRQAEFVLLGLVVFMLALSFYFFFK